MESVLFALLTHPTAKKPRKKKIKKKKNETCSAECENEEGDKVWFSASTFFVLLHFNRNALQEAKPYCQLNSL